MEVGRAAAVLTRRHWMLRTESKVLEHHAVVVVRPGQEGGKRDPSAVDDQMPFGSRLAAIGAVRSYCQVPFFARTLALSRLARSQLMRFASPRQSSSVWCTRCQIPAACQSRTRRQQVMPAW